MEVPGNCVAASLFRKYDLHWGQTEKVLMR
jgi:hypothetical protein